MYMLSRLVNILRFVSQILIGLVVGFFLGFMFAKTGSFDFVKNIISFTPKVAYADISFDRSSPREVDTDIVPICSVGDTFSTYDDTDTVVDLDVDCDGDNYFTSSVPMVLTVVECDGDCGSALLADALISGNYVSDRTYTFVSEYLLSSVGTCPAGDICYYDWLLVNLFIIFLLSLLVMGLFINFFPYKKGHYYDY